MNKIPQKVTVNLNRIRNVNKEWIVINTKLFDRLVKNLTPEQVIVWLSMLRLDEAMRVEDIMDITGFHLRMVLDSIEAINRDLNL